jgi:hypothetical protein
MDKFPTRVRVTASRVSDHIDDVHLRAGDSVAVGHRNQQYPEFVWCATEDGHAGWAPEACLEMTGPGSAVSLREYDAAHLTVSKGEVLEALEQVGDWVRCRNDAGREGWVRSDALEPAAEI